MLKHPSLPKVATWAFMVVVMLPAMLSCRANAGDDQYAFVLFDGKHRIASVSSEDIARADAARGHAAAPMLWFRKGEHEYRVDDPAAMARMRQFWLPVEQLGQSQSELGDQQAAIGNEQSKLGEQMARVGSQLGALAEQRSSLAEKAARSRGKSSSDLRMEAELDRENSGLDRQMAALSKQMDVHSRKQDALSEKQAGFSRRQDAASAQADRETRRLLDQLISNGQARLLTQ